MTYRLLFDENLSPELVELAIAAGYVNSTCVRDRGLRAVKDWELMAVIIPGDYTLVTLNSIDFRGRGAASPGGLYVAGQPRPLRSVTRPPTGRRTPGSASAQ
jgi:hypothetical protein